MKRIIATILLILFLGLGVYSTVDARSIRVRGYNRRDGIYVAPHYRTSPNRNKFDNWSTKGNYNPFTGRRGTVDPFNTYRFRY